MPDTTSKRFAHIRFGVRTDVGRKRRNNEDAHGEWPAQGVFCVADGMGGAQDGEVASRAVVESLAGLLPRWAAFDPPMAQEDRLDALARALDAASFWVKSYADSQGKKGCGSTFVGVCLDPGDPAKAVAVHAGDSRVYRVRGKKIVQITRDHSVAQMAGVKDEKELSPMFRSLILRAVGIKPAVETERTPFDVAEGDRILICSDGLSRMVPDKEIARIVEAAESPNAAADALVDRANELGGKDNVTVVAVFVGALPAPAGVRARLAEEEMAALFAAPGGGEGDSTTGVTDGGTRSDDTGLTIPKGAGAFDTSSSGEFLPPGGLPPPKAPLDDEDDDEDDEPPPDTDEIPASARMKRRLRGLALAASHALRTPAGAAVAAALVAVLLGIAVPPMRRAAAERRQAEEAARIEAEKEKAEAERRERRDREIAALFETNRLLLAKSDEVLRQIKTTDVLGGVPSEDEIDRLYRDGRNALSGTGSFTRDFPDYEKIEDEWTNRFVQLTEARARRIEELKEESAKAAEAAAEAEKAAAEAAQAATRAKDRLAEEERKWMAEADGLSNRIERAALSADASLLGPEIKKLFGDGAAAFGALDETVRGLPEFSSAVDNWSNRCVRLSEACSRRAEMLAEDEKKKAEDKERKRKTKILASAFEQWCGSASALSNRISRASSASELPDEREVADLSSRGREALDKSGLVRNDPALVEKETAWSDRCDGLATQWKERKRALEEERRRANRDQADRLAKRAEIWGRLADENKSEYLIDPFRAGVTELVVKLSGMDDGEATALADRISAAVANDIGSLCSVLEDVFVHPSLLWRFVAAPGVVRAEARCGFSAGSDDVANAEDAMKRLLFAWRGLAALGEKGDPDAARWKAFHSMVCNFAYDAIGDETKPPVWDDGLGKICQALGGDVPGTPRKAKDCLSDVFENWKRSSDPDFSFPARLSDERLSTWDESRVPDDGFALVVAGFETIFCSDAAQRRFKEKGWGDVLSYNLPTNPSVNSYLELLSVLRNRMANDKEGSR